MKQNGEKGLSGGLAGAGIKGLLLVVIVVIAIVAVAAVASDDTDDNGTDNNGSDDNGGSSTSDDDTITVTTGDTDSEKTISYTNDDALTAVTYTNDDGATVIKVTLADSLASNYSTFNWYVMSGSSYVGYISKTDPYATWTLTGDEIGTYTFGVECQSQTTHSFRPGGFGPSWSWTTTDRTQDYEMTITITGTVTKSYSWTYDGNSYTASVSYDYSEFEKYSGTTGASLTERETFDDLTSFIVVNDVVTSLEDQLAAKYTATYSTEASGQGYAEFILAFIQICYSYLYDQSLYGEAEYYAFPMETIQNGGGDCEDTSILCAALFEAAGYDAGVFLIPGHCIAAVALDSYTPGDVDSSYAKSVAQFHYTYDGKTYYGCETTLDENVYGVGWISSDYAIDSDGAVSYQGSTTYRSGHTTVTYQSQGYGFYKAALITA